MWPNVRMPLPLDLNKLIGAYDYWPKQTAAVRTAAGCLMSSLFIPKLLCGLLAPGLLCSSLSLSVPSLPLLWCSLSTQIVTQIPSVIQNSQSNVTN